MYGFLFLEKILVNYNRILMNIINYIRLMMPERIRCWWGCHLWWLVPK